jgi:predicted nucleic acid-binding protein
MRSEESTGARSEIAPPKRLWRKSEGSKLPQTVYFDTSIFIEMGAKRSRYKRDIKALLKDLFDERARVYTSIITIEEVSVAAYRPGEIARDTYGDVKALAKVRGIDKEIALTCAKNEAALKYMADQEDAKRDKSKPETFDQKLERICENRRRRWDCFHIATAQALQCTEFYTTDEKLLRRPTQLGIKGLRAVRPGTSLRRIPGPLTTPAGEIEVK